MGDVGHKKRIGALLEDAAQLVSLAQQSAAAMEQPMQEDQAELAQSAEDTAEEQLADEEADMLGVWAARLLAMASADANIDRAEVAATLLRVLFSKRNMCVFMSLDAPEKSDDYDGDDSARLHYMLRTNPEGVKAGKAEKPHKKHSRNASFVEGLILQHRE